MNVLFTSRGWSGFTLSSSSPPLGRWHLRIQTLTALTTPTTQTTPSTPSTPSTLKTPTNPRRAFCRAFNSLCVLLPELQRIKFEDTLQVCRARGRGPKTTNANLDSAFVENSPYFYHSFFIDVPIFRSLGPPESLLCMQVQGQNFRMQFLAIIAAHRRICTTANTALDIYWSLAGNTREEKLV